MSFDSRGCRLVSDLNSAFRKDPDIDEYDFLPVLEPKHNRSPLILQEHKLGLEMWSVKILHQYAYSTLFTWRMKEANAKFLSPTDLASLTRAIVLVNPDCTTAWNVRKELVENGDLSIADDLKLGALVLGKHPKSPETFCHRKWLFQTLVDTCLTNSSGSTVSNSSLNVYNNFVNMDAIDVNLDPNIPNGYIVNAHPPSNQPDFREHAFRELKNCQKASEKYPSNYNAWSHRIWVVEHCFNCSIQVLFGELHATENWVCKHISDHSGFHYRQFLLTSLQKQSLELQEQFSVCYKNLIQKELAMIVDLIKTYQGHEALWYHRRFIFQNLCQSYSAGTLVELFQNDCDDDIVRSVSQKKTKLENERQVLLLKEIDMVTKSDLTSKDKFHKNLGQKYIDWIQKFSRSLES